MNTQSIDTSQLHHKEISYQDLLETAFNSDTPDEYANYLQGVLRHAREVAKEIDWQIDFLSFVLNQKTGRIQIWG